MKKLFVILSMIAGLAAWTKAADVDAGITKCMDEFDAAWGKHDAKEMASHWLPDGDLINPFGRVANGREEIEKLFTDEHASVFKASTMEIKVLSSRTLADGLVLVDAEANAKNAMVEEGKSVDMSYHLVNVFKKTDDGWKIVSCRPYMFLKH